LEFLPGDVLTAYDAQGRCVGRTKWTPGHPPLLVLWADDPVTPDRDGLQKDDPFTIHWQSTKRQATFRLHPTYQDTPTTYAHDRLFLVTSLHAELDMGPLPEPPPPVGDIATTLHAPYPSPASHRLNLMFDLVSFRPVQVEVYDLLGRRVALLADGLYAAGKHELTWSLDALPSGHYLIRMRSGPIHTVKRFVRLR
ncbi:MAG: T9SS type A sorting domain-containing protein, partial [Bacteroidota bacterium]